MYYKGVHKDDLPIYDPYNVRSSYATFSINSHYHITTPEKYKTYVRYKNYSVHGVFHEVRWYVSEKWQYVRKLENNLRYILMRGGDYEFRRTSVPGVHRYKSYISAQRGAGIMKERRDTEEHMKLEKEYGQLVRNKRRCTAKTLNSWDAFEYHGRREKGWKRSKKRKQWM